MCSQFISLWKKKKWDSKKSCWNHTFGYIPLCRSACKYTFLRLLRKTRRRLAIKFLHFRGRRGIPFMSCWESYICIFNSAHLSIRYGKNCKARTNSAMWVTYLDQKWPQLYSTTVYVSLISFLVVKLLNSHDCDWWSQLSWKCSIVALPTLFMFPQVIFGHKFSST